MDSIKFIRDIPYPGLNVELYKNIYIIEQWLRRITYTTLLLCHGEHWLDQIPAEILSSLKQRRGNLKGRIILDCENNSNIVWLTTVDELHKILTMDLHWNIVTELTGFVKKDFTEWINILREIRNIIGHNRATTFQTLNICNGIHTYLYRGISLFKQNVFFTGYNRRSREYDAEGYRIEDKRIPEALLLFLKTKYFFKIDSTQNVKRDANFIDIAAIIDLFRPLENVILAIEVDITGGEYSIIWTNNISDKYEDHIISKTVDAELSVWKKDDYINQSAKHLCDPIIWFYDQQSVLDGDDGIIDKEAVNKLTEPNNIIKFPLI